MRWVMMRRLYRLRFAATQENRATYLFRPFVCLLVYTTLGALTSCHRNFPSPDESHKAATEPCSPSHALPTATEVFNLRAECARLAQKILDEDIHGDHVSVDQQSRYNTQTNRCYVELDSRTADDRGASFGESSLYLYDGQTGDLLASVVVPSRVGDTAHESGNIFVEHERHHDEEGRLPVSSSVEDHKKASIADDYADAKQFIYDTMADDRTQ